MPRPALTAETFWSHVNRSGGPDACWPWQRSKCRRGYGYARWQGKNLKAHRVAFFLAHGRFPPVFGCHSCDNPPCCNPKHIFEGDALSNMQDKISKKRHRYGVGHPRAKLDDAAITAIKEARARRETIVSIGARFGVAHTTISRVALGKNWSHVD